MSKNPNYRQKPDCRANAIKNNSNFFFVLYRETRNISRFDMSRDKFLIIKGIAGMGNRLLALLDGILYSQITGRKLVIDWRDRTYSSNNQNRFPKFFTAPKTIDVAQISNSNSELGLNHKLSVYPPLWRNNLEKSVGRIVNEHEPDNSFIMTPRKNYRLLSDYYKIDLKRIDYSEEILVRWSFFGEVNKLRRHFQGEFISLKSLSDEAIYSKLIKENLLLNEDIQNQINDFRTKKFTDKTIGVHVRYTDRKLSYHKYFYYINKILKINPNSVIFLATDNRLVEQHFQEIYKNKIVSTSKFLPAQNPEDKKLKGLHHHSSCPDKYKVGVEALVDIYLLASCDYLICNRSSTFAVVARLISNIPEANFIDTSQYMLQKQFRRFVERLT